VSLLKLFSIVCPILLGVMLWSNIILCCSLDIFRSNIIQIYLIRSVFKLKCNMMQYSQRKLYTYKIFSRTLVLSYNKTEYSSWSITYCLSHSKRLITYMINLYLFIYNKRRFNSNNHKFSNISELVIDN